MLRMSNRYYNYPVACYKKLPSASIVSNNVASGVKEGEKSCRGLPIRDALSRNTTNMLLLIKRTRKEPII